MAGKHRSARSIRPRHLALTMLAVAGIALMAVVLSGFGAGGTFAAWNSSVAIGGGTVQTGSAALSAGNFGALGYTASSSTTVAAAPITVSNTGSTPLTSFSSQASASTGSALAAAATVAIWPTTSGATTCPTAAPTGTASTTGNLTAVTNWLPGVTSIAAGTTDTFCAAITVSSATQAAYPSTSATVTVAFQGWTGSGQSGWSTGSVTSASFTLTTPAAGPTTIPGSAAGLKATSSSGTATVTINTSLDSNQMADAYYPCLTINITTTSKTATTWKLTVNDAAQPFNDIPFAKWAWTNGSGAAIYTGNKNASGGTLVLEGSNTYGNLYVSSSSPVVLTFCLNESGYKAPIESASSGAFTESTPFIASCSNQSQPATQYSACIYTTLTGTDPYFYVGYTLTINTATVEKGTAFVGYTISNVVPNPGGNATLTKPTGTSTTYTITSDGLGPQDGAIGNNEQIVIQAYLQAP